ncbi:MAG: hypothetical protein ACI92W_002968, partial [Paraglaciecola sp.]
NTIIKDLNMNAFMKGIYRLLVKVKILLEGSVEKYSASCKKRIVSATYKA